MRVLAIVKVALLICASAIVVSSLGLAQEGGPAGGNTLPAGAGREIVAVACAQCHGLNAFTWLRQGQVAWRFVVRRGEDVAQRIRQHFPNGVDGLADGAVLKEKVIPAVKDGGAFTSVRGFEGVPTRGIRFSTTYVREYVFERDKLDGLRQLVDEGKITLRVAATYKPEEAPEAHRRLEAGGTRGRIVITF